MGDGVGEGERRQQLVKQYPQPGGAVLLPAWDR